MCFFCLTAIRTTILIGKDFFPPIITIISIIPSNYALDESGGHFTG